MTGAVRGGGGKVEGGPDDSEGESENRMRKQENENEKGL